MNSKLISEKIIKYLNYRISQEEISSRLYEQMSLWLNNEGYMNAAKLWKRYADEELTHAGWAKEYLLSLGVMPELISLPKPVINVSSLVDIINSSYDHEVMVTEQCKELAKLASEEDYLLMPLALKYVHEQVEELEKMQTFKDMLATFGTSKESLFLLDKELANY